MQLNVRYELLFCRMQLWVRPVCAIQWRWFDPVRQDNFRFARDSPAGPRLTSQHVTLGPPQGAGGTTPPPLGKRAYLDVVWTEARDRLTPVCDISHMRLLTPMLPSPSTLRSS